MVTGFLSVQSDTALTFWLVVEDMLCCIEKYVREDVLPLRHKGGQDQRGRAHRLP